MKIRKLLIANRGEIAVRIARAAADIGIEAVLVFSADDIGSAHLDGTAEKLELPGEGAAAYLNIEGVIAAAVASGCDAVHPGYGFLSESADFALRCQRAGLRFVGPKMRALKLFGDKAAARALAQSLGIPVLAGTAAPTSLRQAQQFLAKLGTNGSAIIKAVSGGGGRGMRIVHHGQDLKEAFTRCQSEAQSAVGNSSVYLEHFLPRARHIEVQIIGDGAAVSHLWDRDCSLQRRHQKLVEIAPAPNLSDALRNQMIEAALALARATKYSGLGTFEFLVGLDNVDRFVFIEANPRLQVEHTVTEEVTGIDLVAAQIGIAGGATLAELSLTQSEISRPKGYAIQMRLNAESLQADGVVVPSAGTLTRFDAPLGPHVRVDTHAYAGYAINPRFDSLLAKLIVRSRTSALDDAVKRARRALAEFHVSGVATNSTLLKAILARKEVTDGNADTRFVERTAAELLREGVPFEPLSSRRGGSAEPHVLADEIELPEGDIAVGAPMAAVVVSMDVESGNKVRAGEQLAVLEAMKMQHVIEAPISGIVRAVLRAPGATVRKDDFLVIIHPTALAAAAVADIAQVDPDHIRPDLAEVLERRRAISDEARPDAVAKRRRTGQRTARENLGALFDRGAFMEYGEFAIAGRRGRQSVEELKRLSPADGLITGIGHINGHVFPPDLSRAVGMAYDYTVFAGTQGLFNHAKTDRMLDLACRDRLPVVLYAEGGGGRPGESDWPIASGISVNTFRKFAALSGLAATIGIAAGRCFAGNAALLGCADVIIATRDANIGMGGPAVIDGAGLGLFKPEDIGPASIQGPNGVIDVLVDDENHATQAARKYLSYFQGTLHDTRFTDQRSLRHAVPENRLRSYNVRRIIDLLADENSVLELRELFAPGMITSLIRVEGVAVGVVANNPGHLGGAVDADGADKAARFMQLCDAYDIPMLSLCDTPGFMVGPDAEKTAQVRKFARMFITAASLTTPLFSIILRKAYGLGAQAMTFGGGHEPAFTVAWPTGELGGMGPEAAIHLGYKKELDEAGGVEQREALYQHMVANVYAASKALNVASYAEIDSVIDPSTSRDWIVAGLRAAPPACPRRSRKRLCIDAW